MTSVPFIQSDFVGYKAQLIKFLFIISLFFNSAG